MGLEGTVEERVELQACQGDDRHLQRALACHRRTLTHALALTSTLTHARTLTLTRARARAGTHAGARIVLSCRRGEGLPDRVALGLGLGLGLGLRLGLGLGLGLVLTLNPNPIKGLSWGGFDLAEQAGYLGLG